MMGVLGRLRWNAATNDGAASTAENLKSFFDQYHRDGKAGPAA